jgi:hypothetical protein
VTAAMLCLAAVTMFAMYMLSSYAIVVLGLISLLVIYRIVVVILDFRRFRKCNAIPQIKSADILCNILLDFKSSHYRAKFLRQLRTGNRLAGMRSQVLPDLEKLADVWSPTPATRYFRSSLKNTKTLFGNLRTNRKTKKPYSRRETMLNGWDSSSRDELFKLIEQLRQIPNPS